MKYISIFLDKIIYVSIILLAYSFFLRFNEFGFDIPKKSQFFRHDAFFLIGYICCFIQLNFKANKNFKYYIFIAFYLLFYTLEGVRTVILVNLIILIFYVFLFKKIYFSKFLIITTIIFLYFLMSNFSEYIFKTIVNFDGTFLVRILAWKDLLLRISNNIFLGHGLGSHVSIDRYFSTSGGDVYIGSPHNVLLTLLYLIGIFGLLPFFYIILNVLIYKSKYISYRLNFFLKLILILTLVYFSFQPLGSDFYVTFWIVYSLVYTIQRNVEI